MYYCLAKREKRTKTQQKRDIFILKNRGEEEIKR